MKVQLAAVFAWTAASTDAFAVPSNAFVRSSGSCLSATTPEFDYLLNENGANQAGTSPRSRRVVTAGSQQSTQLLLSKLKKTSMRNTR
jgi:hypothetical protein